MVHALTSEEIRHIFVVEVCPVEKAFSVCRVKGVSRDTRTLIEKTMHDTHLGVSHVVEGHRRRRAAARTVLKRLLGEDTDPVSRAHETLVHCEGDTRRQNVKPFSALCVACVRHTQRRKSVSFAKPPLTVVCVVDVVGVATRVVGDTCVADDLEGVAIQTLRH